MSTPHQQHIRAYFDNLNVNQGVSDEVMRDIGYDTQDTVVDSLERSAPIAHVNDVRPVGQTTLAHSAQLQEVDEDYSPPADAPREATFRGLPPARTAQDRFHRDMGESARRKPPAAQAPWPPIRRVK